MLVAGLLLYARAFVRVEQGHALVVSKPGRVDVCFGGALVIPLIHRAEPIDLRTKPLVIRRSGKDGLVCRDDVRVDLEATFYVRVSKTADDVLKVAQSIGCARAGDPAVLQELLVAKFSEALKTVARHLELEELHTRRHDFKEQVLEMIGEDLGGYVLDDVAIDHLVQTPIGQLDPNDILDAAGIRTITERTTREHVLRNQLELEAKRARQRQQLELEELVIELQRRKADALGRFREATGRELSEAELRERIDEHLRALVRPVVEEVLEQRLARSRSETSAGGSRPSAASLDSENNHWSSQ